MLRCLAVSLFAISIYNAWQGSYGFASIFGIGTSVALGVMARVYYDSLTILFAPLLAEAARTGDEQLLDDRGHLPRWFTDEPERWFHRLVRSRPERST